MLNTSNININIEMILATFSTVAAVISALFARKANNLSHTPYLAILKPKYNPAWDRCLSLEIENQGINNAYSLQITTYGLKNYFPLYSTKHTDFETFTEILEPNTPSVYKAPEYDFSCFPKMINTDLPQIMVFLKWKTISNKKQKSCWLIHGPLLMDVVKLTWWERILMRIKIEASRFPYIYKWGSKFTEKKFQRAGGIIEDDLKVRLPK